MNLLRKKSQMTDDVSQKAEPNRRRPDFFGAKDAKK